MRLVRAVAAAWLAVVLALSGCDRRVEGHATVGSREVDPGYFFAGDVAVFGQPVTDNDKTVLAYLRALRRVDVCGLLTGGTLNKVGELLSVATLYAFNECDVELKVPTANGRKLLSVELVMTDQPGNAVAVGDGETPIYRNLPGCQYLVPLPLERLPGAPALHMKGQPFVRIGLIVEDDCGLVQRVANGVAQRLSTRPLPVRDGAAVYPSVLAERDPCEVLGPLGADVDRWDIVTAEPHECQFGLRPNTTVAPLLPTGRELAIQLKLQPRDEDSVAEGSERLQRDGVEVYLGRVPCSAVSFVGPQMQRRVIGVGFVDVTNVEVRPAVVAESGAGNCDEVADVAVRAAKLYS